MACMRRCDLPTSLHESQGRGGGGGGRGEAWGDDTCIPSNPVNQESQCLRTMKDALPVVGGDLQQEGVQQGLRGAAGPAPQGLSPLAAGADLLQPALQQQPVGRHTTAQRHLRTSWTVVRNVSPSPC